MIPLCRIALIMAVTAIQLVGQAPESTTMTKNSDTRTVLVLLGEWFGDTYFPLKQEIDSRGWTMKRVGVDIEYRGCYNKKRDVLLRSDILIEDLKGFSGFDCLIIPSGPQFRKFRDRPEVYQFVRDVHAAGILVASFCTGNMVVQESGLVDFPMGPELFPSEVKLVKEGILLGPRGGGPPPGDGYKSVPIKEICDAVARELAQKKDFDYFPELRGPYLGQDPPGLKPEVFAPGIISTPDEYEINSVFSADGNEFYYVISASSPEEKEEGVYYYYLMWSRRADGIWSKPQRLSIAGEYSVLDIALSPDGNRLFFCSDLPVERVISEGYDIWYIERSETGWSKPVNLGSPVNSPKGETQPSFTCDGSIYFPSSREGSNLKDIYFSEYSNGEYMNPIALPETINSQYHEGNSFISPDGDYILFSRYGMPESIDGGKALYISFRKTDGTWTQALNTGPVAGMGGSLAALSPDGKYLFYSQGGDIYWVDAGIIDVLRVEAMKENR